MKKTKKIRPQKGFFYLGDFSIQTLPSNNVIGGFGYKTSISRSPSFIPFQSISKYFIGLLLFIEDQVKGIYCRENQITV